MVYDTLIYFVHVFFYQDGHNLGIHPTFCDKAVTGSLVPFWVVDSNASWRRSWTPTLCMEVWAHDITAIFHDI